MRSDQERSRLSEGHTRFRVRAPGWLGQVLASVAAVLLLVVAFFFSLLVFAVVALGGLLAWGYVWWKTREMRKAMRERPPAGRVIEGEASREAHSGDTIER